MGERDFATVLQEAGRSPCALAVASRGLWFPCRFAAGFWDRLRGLLGTHAGRAGSRVLVLAPCRSIHTVGMSYAIDVAVVDAGGLVLSSVRGLQPGSMRSWRGAWAVLEREESTADWFEEGDRLVCWQL